MAPPPTNPRLDALDADAVALDAARRVASALSRLAMQVQPGTQVHISSMEDAQLRASQVYLSALDLVQYAQRGGADDEAEDLLLSVVSTLTASPLDANRAVAPVPEQLVSELDESDPLSLACVAAWARYRLSRGESLTAAQLAALASLSVSQIRRLSETDWLTPEGEVKPKVGARFSAQECRNFLAQRAVPPFGEPLKLSPEAFAKMAELIENPPEPTPEQKATWERVGKAHAEMLRRRGRS